MKNFALVSGLALSTCTAAVATPHDAVDLCAAVLIAEAGGEGDDGMIAVACVIRNRKAGTDASYWTILTRRKQFSCLNGTSTGKLVERAKRHPHWWSARLIAKTAMFDQFYFDSTHGATHFHSGPKPWWAHRFTRTVTIGNLHFYR